MRYFARAEDRVAVLGELLGKTGRILEDGAFKSRLRIIDVTTTPGTLPPSVISGGHRGQPAQEGGARGTAYGNRAVGVIETHGGFDKAVEIWGFVLRMSAGAHGDIAQIVQIVKNDKQDIGMSVFVRCLRNPCGESHGKQA